VWCTVAQCVAVSQPSRRSNAGVLQSVEMCCNVLQCVAACCSVLQRVAV